MIYKSNSTKLGSFVPATASDIEQLTRLIGFCKAIKSICTSITITNGVVAQSLGIAPAGMSIGMNTIRKGYYQYAIPTSIEFAFPSFNNCVINVQGLVNCSKGFRKSKSTVRKGWGVDGEVFWEIDNSAVKGHEEDTPFIIPIFEKEFIDNTLYAENGLYNKCKNIAQSDNTTYAWTPFMSAYVGDIIADMRRPGYIDVGGDPNPFASKKILWWLVEICGKEYPFGIPHEIFPDMKKKDFDRMMYRLWLHPVNSSEFFIEFATIYKEYEIHTLCKYFMYNEIEEI